LLKPNRSFGRNKYEEVKEKLQNVNKGNQYIDPFFTRKIKNDLIDQNKKKFDEKLELIKSILSDSEARQVVDHYLNKLQIISTYPFIQDKLNSNELYTPFDFYDADGTIRDRCKVIDLVALEPEHRPMVVTSILNKEWTAALKRWRSALAKDDEKDKRTPVFIVIDEAHNIIPSNPSDESQKLMVNEFRKITAEGRKYGLFLLLLTQNPNKIDPVILSECTNFVIMKITSKTILKRLKDVIGLDEKDEILKKSNKYTPGFALLSGTWVTDNITEVYSFSRRTMEGGRNMQKNFWSIPFET
jgi:DNA helicase HerA-like ATPase